ncbi:putative FAS1 domain-containing protein [Helianthus annuus]|nr:putative FAS1 domain-containing protein [Helianthus annuus]
MSKFFSLLLLLLLTTTATCLHQLSTLNSSSSPAPSPSNQPSPPPAPEYMQQQQLKNIIDALIGAGDFAAWANILFNPTSNSSNIPPSTTATMFVPGNDALSRLSATATGAYSFDPFIIPYHVLPQRLTFSDLQQFKTRTRIPTLLPSKTIVITSNAPDNFTIDDSLIVQPDIYTNAAVCVHGIADVLDYKVYGDAGQPPPSFVAPPPLPPLPPADETETVTTPPDVVSSMRGDLFFQDCIHFDFLDLLKLVSSS